MLRKLSSPALGNGTYVGSEDVVGDRRLVDSRVLVGLEMDQGIVRDALGGSFFYRTLPKRLALLWSGVMTGQEH